MKFKLPLHSNKKLLLAFEYGVNISEVAKKMNVELTPELIKRAEEIILEEFQSRSATAIACDTVPTILSIFQPEEAGGLTTHKKK